MTLHLMPVDAFCMSSMQDSYVLSRARAISTFSLSFMLWICSWYAALTDNFTKGRAQVSQFYKVPCDQSLRSASAVSNID